MRQCSLILNTNVEVLLQCPHKQNITIGIRSDYYFKDGIQPSIFDKF